MNVEDFELYPWIEPYVTQLLKTPTGFCVGGVKVEEPLSGAPSDLIENGVEKNDIFTVVVPVAGEVFRWQIIFDGSNTDAGPDVLLPDLDDFDPDYEKISSMSNWDKIDINGLLKIVQDLVREFKIYQRKKCQELDQDLSKEIDELSMTYENIELCVKNFQKTGGQKLLNVLVQINMDFSKLCEEFQNDMIQTDPMIKSPLLLIKYDLEQSRALPQVFLPSHIEQIFGGRGTTSTPPYTPSMSLLEYVNKVREQLRDSTAVLTESHGKRIEYIAAFLRQFPGDTLEYDATNFLKISLILSFQKFFFFVHVHLSRLFPREQPVMTFQSAYHMSRRSQLFQMVCNTYPYSPRWSGVEMAKRAKLFIHEKASLFKDNCVRHGLM